MPSRRDRSFISSRICAWMVTSSAVVGSSAISSLGLQASPIAIITRWRMPPESWCGYWSSRLSGSVMPTRVSSSMARARAAASSMLEMDGERLHDLQPDLQHRVERGHRLLEDHGDLAAADARASPRRRARAARGRRSGSSPGMRAVPGGSSRMTASADTDLPEPDSPTMATISPGWTE